VPPRRTLHTVESIAPGPRGVGSRSLIRGTRCRPRKGALYIQPRSTTPPRSTASAEYAASAGRAAAMGEARTVVPAKRGQSQRPGLDCRIACSGPALRRPRWSRRTRGPRDREDRGGPPSRRASVPRGDNLPRAGGLPPGGSSVARWCRSEPDRCEADAGGVPRTRARRRRQQVITEAGERRL
jgi:hypothetical protein